MKKGKNAVSNVVLGDLLILIGILSVSLIYLFLIPYLKESAININTDQFTTNINFYSNSITSDENNSLIEFSLKKNGEGEISYLRAYLFTDKGELKYNLLKVPEDLEKVTYVLYTTRKKINSIVIYPVFKNSRNGMSVTNKFFIDGHIEPKIQVINPVLNEKCQANFICSNYSKCAVNYDLNNLLKNESTISSEETRVCNDINNCDSSFIERNECSDKQSVLLKKVNENNKNFIYIYNTNNSLISKVEFIPGEHNILNVEMDL